MSTQYNPTVVTDGLQWYVDAANVKSYPGSGTAWYDLSGNGRTQTLVNGAAITTVGGAKAINTSVEGYYTVDAGVTYTLTNGYTLLAWARTLADSQVTNWRTLWRTQPDDHPLLIQDGTNTIGYYDNNAGGFASYGLNAGTLGIENVWTMYTLIGSGATTTLYINNMSSSGVVNYNAGGTSHDAFGAAAGSQAFGYVAVGMIYSRAISTAEIAQNYNALRGRFGL